MEILNQEETVAIGCEDFGILCLCPGSINPDHILQCVTTCQSGMPQSLVLLGKTQVQ